MYFLFISRNKLAWITVTRRPISDDSIPSQHEPQIGVPGILPKLTQPKLRLFGRQLLVLFFARGPAAKSNSMEQYLVWRQIS